MAGNDRHGWKIAISTGGGDAPGLNAVIRAVTLSALRRGWRCSGIRDGFNGLLMPEEYVGGGLVPLTAESVDGITALGGTILGTTNRGNPIRFPVRRSDGGWDEIDRSDELIRLFALHGIDALVSIGGDGSLEIANVLAGKGLRVVGVPKTIDNDLDRTVATFGFETAAEFATECVDRLHSTAAAHGRVMVVEVMGRYAGWIALSAGVAGSADAILIPEIPYDMERLAAKIRETEARGKRHAIVVVAEGAKPVGGETSRLAEASPGQAERLGGDPLAGEIEEQTGREVRTVVLGHLQRGGTPTPYDRLLALRFGAAAVRALAQGESGIMVALDPPVVLHVPLAEATRRMKTVPLDADTVLTARDLGISFGD